MIDTHCHLTYPGLAEREAAVVAEAAAVGVDRLISIGTSIADSEAAVAAAGRHRGVWATVGIHPLHAAEVGPLQAAMERLRWLARQPNVVGLGEFGLDRHHAEPPAQIQAPAFEAQLKLAVEPDLAHLPVVIHNRKATEVTLRMLRQARGLDPARVVFHCFTGDADEVRAILAYGAWVGFTGVVTFRNAADVAEASDRVPTDRLLIETDAPYLTPAPLRSVRPNEPKYLPHTLKFLAQRRGLAPEVLDQITTANAERLFRLDPAGGD